MDWRRRRRQASVKFAVPRRHGFHRRHLQALRDGSTPAPPVHSLRAVDASTPLCSQSRKLSLATRSWLGHEKRDRAIWEAKSFETLPPGTGSPAATHIHVRHAANNLHSLHKSYHKGASSDKASICDAQAVSEDQEKSSQRGGKDSAGAIRTGVNIIIKNKMYVCMHVCTYVRTYVYIYKKT